MLELAQKNGVIFHFNAEVQQIITENLLIYKFLLSRKSVNSGAASVELNRANRK